MWVRGLKLLFFVLIFSLNMSHPVWVRGLKLEGVAKSGEPFRGRTPCGCVD